VDHVREIPDKGFFGKVRDYAFEDLHRHFEEVNRGKEPAREPVDRRAVYLSALFLSTHQGLIGRKGQTGNLQVADG